MSKSVIGQMEDMARDYFQEFIDEAHLEDNPDAMKCFLHKATNFAVAARKHAYQWMSPDREITPGFFRVTSVHRDDLDYLGFDTSKVSDETMDRLSEKLEDDYCEQLFWTSLKIIAQELKIPVEK
jgi:hypothetical protein